MPLMKRVKENCKWMCVIKRDYTLCVISQSSLYSARQTARTMKPENGYDANFVVTDDIRVCHNKLRCCHWREYWFDVNFDVNFVAGSTRGCHNDNLQCGQCCHHDNSQLCKSYNQRGKSTNHCRLLWWQCYPRKICNAIKKVSLRLNEVLTYFPHIPFWMTPKNHNTIKTRSFRFNYFLKY